MKSLTRRVILGLAAIPVTWLTSARPVAGDPRLLEGEPRAVPGEPPPVPGEPRRPQGWHQVEGQWVRASATVRWTHLLSVHRLNGRLSLTPRGVDASGRRLVAGTHIDPAREVLIEVPVSPVASRNDAGGYYAYLLRHHERSMTLRLAGEPPDLPAGTWRVRLLSINGPHARVEAIRREPADANPTGETVLALTLLPQQPIRVERTQAGRTRVSVATTLGDLLTRHPVVAREEVTGVLAAIGAGDVTRPGTADVYTAFGMLPNPVVPNPVVPDADLPDDEADAGEVRRLVAALADPTPATRRRAEAELRSLSLIAAAAAVRHLPDPLTPPETRLRLREVLEADRLYVDTAGDALRQNPYFLLDCLLIADPRVRAAALERLPERVRTRMGEAGPPDAPRQFRADEVLEVIASISTGAGDSESPEVP